MKQYLKFFVFLSSLFIFASCADVRNKNNNGSSIGTTSQTQNPPRFGLNGTESTIANNSTIVNNGNQNDTNQTGSSDANINVTDPDPGVTENSTERNQSSGNSSDDNQTERNSGESSSTTTNNQTNQKIVRLALPHPNPDFVRNPYNPSQKIRVKNLPNGKPDYPSGFQFGHSREKRNELIELP